ncbi:unnamed protein product [Hanseniaspora opuntiae]
MKSAVKSIANASTHTSILNKKYPRSAITNVTPNIIKHIGLNLHNNKNSPIYTIRQLIENTFDSSSYRKFDKYNTFGPIVTVKKNFDDLGFPKDHVGRSKSDTYYINDELLLRTHTSAHEVECFKNLAQAKDHKDTSISSLVNGHGYLISADVYRRDEIDKTHYPVFHQMEGTKTWNRFTHNEVIESEINNMNELMLKNFPSLSVEDVDYIKDDATHENSKQAYMTDLETELVVKHMKKSLELVVATLLKHRYDHDASKDKNFKNPDIKMRWIEAYFPWTRPSFELEIFYNDEWLEVLGCGVTKNSVFTNADMTPEGQVGWAFGIGLDRLAMLLYNIKDIRLLWSQDKRFTSQFEGKEGTIFEFKPFSTYGITSRDISFFLTKELNPNDVMEIVRDEAQSWCYSCTLVDEFFNKKINKKSQTYRISYQNLERNITTAEINEINDKVVDRLIKEFEIQPRK